MKEGAKEKNGVRGSGHLGTVFFLWIFLVLFSFLLFCWQAYAGIRANRENVQRALDGFVTRHSVELYAMIKRGSAETKAWDDELWELMAEDELRVLPDGNGYASAYDSEGKKKWTMSVPVLSASGNGETGILLRADYVFCVNVPFAGGLLGRLSVPLKAESRFLPK